MYTHFKYTNYSCDELGNVYGPRGKPIGTTNLTTGYHQVTIHYNGSVKTCRKHRFIYECYYGKALPSDKVINHINGVKTDNRLINLELISYSENTKHAIKLGLLKPKKGELNGNCSISKETARSILREILYTTKSNSEIASKFCISSKHVSSIRHKRRWTELYEEAEFKDVIPIVSLNVPQEQLHRQFVILHFCNTNLSNTYISKLLNVDQGTISKIRNGKLYTEVFKLYKQESSTTIENLMTASELVEYRQATGSGVPHNEDDIV